GGVLAGHERVRLGGLDAQHGQVRSTKRVVHDGGPHVRRRVDIALRGTAHHIGNEPVRTQPGGLVLGPPGGPGTPAQRLEERRPEGPVVDRTYAELAMGAPEFREDRYEDVG